MIKGLFAVNFTASRGNFGRGVIVITPEGRIYGGDADYYYTGTLEQNGGALSGHIAVANHSGEHSSVFGPVARFSLRVVGELDPASADGSPADVQQMSLTAQVVEMPGMQLTVHCRKVSDVA